MIWPRDRIFSTVSILLNLLCIPEGSRRTEAEVWQRFNEIADRILAVLLDALVMALREAGNTRLTRLPRMADFAVRAVAAAPALGWTASEFLVAYEGNRASVHDIAIEGSLVAGLILQVVDNANGAWRGTSTALLESIEQIAPEQARKTRGWPRNARALSDEVRRIAPNLRGKGVSVEQLKKNREWVLERPGESASPSSPASCSDSKVGDDIAGETVLPRDDPSKSGPLPGVERNDGYAGDDISPPSSGGRRRVEL